MRQIVLDTETTGLDPKQGHRIIEIACLEMVNRKITGDTYHVYINPQREIEIEAEQVHGISNDFLKDKPLFKDVAQDFLTYVDGAEMIIHNAPFDVGFIDHELHLWRKSVGKISQFCQITDSLKIARQMHMGQRNSLDALCKRYGVDNSHREFHGALLDAELLAKVYLLMTGGQSSLFAEEKTGTAKAKKEDTIVHVHNAHAPLSVIYADDDELNAHKAKLEKMGISDVW